MKNSLLIGIFCLGIGFGAGWVVKPGADPETTDNQPAKAPAKKTIAKAPSSSGLGGEKSAKSETKPESPLTGRAVVKTDAEIKQDAAEQAEKMQNNWQKMMDKRRKAKQDAQIQKLVDRLGLTDAQIAKLRSYFDKNSVDVAALMEGGGDGDWSKFKDLTKKLGGDGLDEALADILTDEQKVAYDEMKQRERANKIEAKAYKDLAKVQSVLDLSQDQKDEVYEILHQRAETNIDQNKDANVMMSMFTEGMGIEIDPDDLGISGAFQMGLERAQSGEPVDEDPNAWMRIMQENRQRQIDEKVELLAPALDDKQEAAYRTHLETQGNGIFGGMLMDAEGVEGADVDVRVESLTIPAPE